jgi:hypothetical protein
LRREGKDESLLFIASSRSIIGQEGSLMGQSSGVRQRENKDYFFDPCRIWLVKEFFFCRG